MAKTKFARTSLPLHYYTFFISLVVWFDACVGLMMPPSPCLSDQEEALLKFKAGLTDPTGRLSSWQVGVDCCKWVGITCDNGTGYVIGIDLHNPQNPYDRLPFDSYAETKPKTISYSGLGGRLDPALAELKRLQYLNLRYNTFGGKAVIPNFIGSMVELRYLYLSYAGFGGKIPSSVGNLSKLEYLDLSSLIHADPHSRYQYESFNDITSRSEAFTSLMSCNDIQWISGLISLKAIRLNQVNLSRVHKPMQVFSSLPALEKLYLSYNSLSTSLDLPVSNFSTLEYLYLTNNFYWVNFPSWVVNTTNLRHIDMTNTYLKGEVTYGLSELPYLTYVNLNFNENLKVNCTKLLSGRWRSLQSIWLYYTDFYGGIPSSMGNVTSLVDLVVSHSHRNHAGLEGNIPRELEKLDLESLALKYKYFLGSLSPTIFNTNSLKEVSFIGIDMGTLNLDWFCQLKFLENISLDNCSLKGHIPTCLFQMPALTTLQLERNQHLNGTLPVDVREDSQLSVLKLGYNSLEGIVDERHLQNLKDLLYLELSYNSIVFKPISTWLPPPSIVDISLASCQIGPGFPLWLKAAANLQYLDLSSNKINGSVPTWLWEKLPSLVQLNLSHNDIQGHLPSPITLSFVLGESALDLGFNKFSGPFPFFTSGIGHLRLSNNRLTGPLPPSITDSPDAFFEFLASNNEIDGEIPLAFGKMNNLRALDLSNNTLVGSLPPNLIGSANLEALDVSWNHLSGQANLNLTRSNVLRSLHLERNFLYGAFPAWLKNCISLEVLDLSQNRFFGEIPKWVGTHITSLKILDLRSNMFDGQIPWQLSLLSSLQVLDVAHNSLNGSIPKNFGNFKAMKEKHVVKQWFPLNDGYYRDKLIISMNGKEDEYGNANLGLVNSLDFSSNKLWGEIPQELTNLSELIVLNLSHNELIHNIPHNIGALKQLLTLDLSHNHLSGGVPASLGTVTFLNHLDLSYNNLSGEIPTGTQLQSFNESTFAGNPELCGAPLLKSCFNSSHPKETTGNEEEEGPLYMLEFYIGLSPGFVVGFWCVCGTLILKRKWRTAYFRFFDEANNRVFVVCMIKFPIFLKGVWNKTSTSCRSGSN